LKDRPESMARFGLLLLGWSRYGQRLSLYISKIRTHEQPTLAKIVQREYAYYPPTDVVCLGLDMHNHEKDSPCRWRVRGSILDGSGGIELVYPSRYPVRAGSEVAIEYGVDDSNAALLLRYGFVDEGNKIDNVLILCPIGEPADWDDHMRFKINLLRVCQPP
jgi:hypothetical protein